MGYRGRGRENKGGRSDIELTRDQKTKKTLNIKESNGLTGDFLA